MAGDLEGMVDLVTAPGWMIRAGATLVFFAAVGYALKRVVVALVLCWIKRPRRDKGISPTEDYPIGHPPHWFFGVSRVPKKPHPADEPDAPVLERSSLSWPIVCQAVNAWALRHARRP